MASVNISEDFGGAIKSARRAMGLTQLQLAGKLCITPRYLKDLENSGRLPSYALFIKIITLLEIRADFTIFPESKEPSAKIYVLQGNKIPG
jgi:transcriptional regulator with XRE-family HTH domain